MVKKKYEKYIGKLCEIILKDSSFVGMIEGIEKEDEEDWIILDYGYTIKVKAVKEINILDDKEVKDG